MMMTLYRTSQMKTMMLKTTLHRKLSASSQISNHGTAKPSHSSLSNSHLSQSCTVNLLNFSLPTMSVCCTLHLATFLKSFPCWLRNRSRGGKNTSNNKHSTSRQCQQPKSLRKYSNEGASHITTFLFNNS